MKKVKFNNDVFWTNLLIILVFFIGRTVREGTPIFCEEKIEFLQSALFLLLMWPIINYFIDNLIEVMQYLKNKIILWWKKRE